MEDGDKTKEQLMSELQMLRTRLTELEQIQIEREQTEQALRESEERYRQVVKHAPTGIYELDMEANRITNVNDVMCEYTGYTREELLSMSPNRLLTDEGKELFAERRKRLLSAEKIPENVEYKIKCKDGRQIWAILNVRSIDEKGKPTKVTVVAHDITERKQIEEELRSSEDRFRMLFEYAPDGYYLSDAEGHFIDGNRAAEEIVGYKREELIGKNFLELKLLSPEQILRAAGLLAQNRLGEPTGPDEFTLNRKDGKQVFVEIRTLPVKIKGEALVLGIARDVTERKQTEEALRQSEERYALTTRAGEVGVWDWSPETNEIYLDPNLKAMLGYRDHEIRNHLDHWGKFVHPDDAKRVMAEANAHLEGLTPHYEIAHRMLHKDGSVRWFLARGTAIRDEKGKVYRVVGTDTDITERKQTEEALRESEKRLRILSSHLLSGQEAERRRISVELHDELGQSLIGLKLQLRSIEKELQKDPGALKKECEKAQRHIDRIIDSVHRLSRDLSPHVLEDLGLSAALRWLISDFSKLHRISASSEIGNIDRYFSREAQRLVYRIFQEALTNIGKHAQATHVSVAIREEADRVSFSVEDDGKGFDAKQAMRRDSTEKGMGLSTMEERAWMLGGSLSIWSQEGGGTRLDFTIPVGQKGS